MSIPTSAPAGAGLPFRIGQGYDCHALVAGRKLILGGVTIPHSMGLLGHSDADALLHAITDALFGAAALGDIGRHFPDTAAEFAGADSRVLLREAVKRVAAAGYRVGNVDATIIAQKPKMARISRPWWRILPLTWVSPLTKSTSRRKPMKSWVIWAARKE